MSSTVRASRGGLGPIERAIRIVGGGALSLVAFDLWLASGGLPAWVWLAAALIGVDFVVTGIRGYCPIYARLGIGRPRTKPNTTKPST